MKNNVLVVVDYQFDFASPQGALYVPEAETIAERIQAAINDPKYDTVIYTMDSHITEEYSVSEEAKIFPDHCVFGSKGWNFFEIQPRNKEITTLMRNSITPKDIRKNDEFVFVKDQFSIWEGSSTYADFINTFNKDTAFTICGLATNYCIFTNVMGYAKQGFNDVSVIENSVKGIKDDTFETAISEMRDANINFIGGV